MFMSAVVLSCLAAAGLMTLASADLHEAAVIELTAIAPPPEPAKDATVEGPRRPRSETGRQRQGARADPATFSRDSPDVP